MHKNRWMKKCGAMLCAMVLACTMPVCVRAEETSGAAVQEEQTDVLDGLNPEETILTVEGEKVPLKKAYFLVKFQQSIVESMQKGMYGSSWYSLPIYEGDKSFQDNMKESIMNLLVRMSLARQHMDEYGVSISKAEQEKIDTAVEHFFASNSDKTIEAMMADKETVTEILTDYTILSKVIVKMTEGTTADYADAKTYSYIYGSITGSSSSVTKSDDSTESMIEAFQSIRDSVKNGENFDTAAANKGYPSAMHTYFAADDSDRLAEINEVMDTLEEGQVSDVIYTKNGKGVFVGYREALDEESLESAKESLLQNEQAKVLRKKMGQWIDKAKKSVNDAVWNEVSMKRSMKAYNASSKSE